MYYDETNGQLFFNMAMELPVHSHFVRACLVEARGVGKIPEKNFQTAFYDTPFVFRK